MGLQKVYSQGNDVRQSTNEIHNHIISALA